MDCEIPQPRPPRIFQAGRHLAPVQALDQRAEAGGSPFDVELLDEAGKV